MPIIQAVFVKHFLAFLYFTVASIYLTFPLISILDTHVSGKVDELYVTWILNWNIHSILNSPLSLFTGNTYYPFGDSIAFSDPYISSSLIALIPVSITQQPIIAYNINLITSFAFLGFSTYLLVYFLNRDHFSSLVAGTVFGFSTYLLPKLGHLQILTCYWIPLSILSYFAFIKFKKFKYFVLTLLFFYLQFLNSFQPAYFILLVLIIITTSEIITKRRKLAFFINKKTFFSMLLTFIFCMPIIYPYYKVSNLYGYTRDIRETIHTANRPEHFLYGFGRSYVVPPIRDLLYKSPGPYLYDGYRGAVSILLTICVISYALYKRSRAGRNFLIFVSIGIATYIISLGPALQFAGRVIKDPFMIPLPYALLYYLAPGFKGFRNSGRWEMYEIFAFCVAIGLFLGILLKSRSLLTKSVVCVSLCFLVLLEATVPFKYYEIRNKNTLPNVYSFIQKTDNPIIAEFPIYNWNMLPYSFEENERLYYSTFHFKKTLNGGGGFSPQPWQEMIVNLASTFPKDESIQKLKAVGVNYIIVHEREFDELHNEKYKVLDYSIPNSKMVKDMLSENKSVKFIGTFDEIDSVYQIIY